MPDAAYAAIAIINQEPTLAILFIIIALLWLSYSNGANDNFKGVATLYGSGGASYKGALLWASLTTAAGCLVSVFFAENLIKVFNGRGLVPGEMLGAPELLIAVGIGAALTIFIATLLGMPTSTTHALLGALLGIIVAGAFIGQADWPAFARPFAAPLLLSPLIAIALAALFYPAARFARRKICITPETCVCIGNAPSETAHLQPDGSLVPASTGLTLTVAQADACIQRYQGSLVGVSAQTLVNATYFLSTSPVCFSHALNDTPKIAALLLAAKALGINPSMDFGAVALAMCAGGLINSRRVAETMSKKITALNAGVGLIANLVTAFLVLFA